MAIKLNAMKQLVNELRELPENESEERELSTQEAVAVASEEIELLRKKGYSLEQIAKLLTDGGLRISESTLKRYLSNVSSKQRKGGKRSTAKKNSAPKKAVIPSVGIGKSGGVNLTSNSEASPAQKGTSNEQEVGGENKPQERSPVAVESAQPGRFVPKNDSTEI